MPTCGGWATRTTCRGWLAPPGGRSTPTAPGVTLGPQGSRANPPPPPSPTRGRDCRNAFPVLRLTCTKLIIAFWDFLGHRIGVVGAKVPYLLDLVRFRSANA